MEIQKYLKEKEEIRNLLINYVDDENENEEDDLLINKINQTKENKIDLKEFLHLILCIFNNHHRHCLFFDKISKILLLIKDQIQQFMSIFDIISLFYKNKRLLLLLIELKIIPTDHPDFQLFFKQMHCYPYHEEPEFITIEKTINIKNLNYSPDQSKFKKICYEECFLCYFYPEVEAFISEEDKRMVQQDLIDLYYDKDTKEFSYSKLLDENRKKGENDSFICSLIRDDLIDEFIPYINKKNISFSSFISPSIFETNEFLHENKKTSLIEYAAFYGSIQIFNFLRLNNADMSPSLWLYAIHGRNPEIIYLLEENKIQPPKDKYEFCLIEAIKCHHIEIVEYISNNYQNLLNDKKDIEDNLETNIFGYYNPSNRIDISKYCFQYHNYAYIKNNIDNDLIALYSCQYDYYTIVEILLKQKKIKLVENKNILH